MRGQAVKVKREKIEACMKCPICNKLLKEATTISLCLHTFCRKCIYEKLSDDEVDCCPVCNIDLGCLPVEKLRPDHNLQDIRAKIFPLKRRKIKAPETLPSLPPPVKRKERSLSSLGVSAPKVSMQTGTTGRRTKALARRASGSRGTSFVFEEPNKKKEDSMEEIAVGSSSQDSLNKGNKRKDLSPHEPSNEQKTNENKENDAELKDAKFDLWTPLNCLVEAANRTKASKLNSQLTSLVEAANGTKTPKGNQQGLSLPKLEPPNMPENKAKVEFPDASGNILNMPKAKSKDQGGKTKFQDDKSGSSSIPGPVKRRRVRATNQKKAAATEELSTSAQLLLDASRGKCNQRDRPIWFSLVASEDQKGEVSLPQIPACYLRIKDGEVPVSIIQKYLVKKLHLTSESEVEILCRGQPVPPTLQLHHLVDLWFRTAATSRRVTATVGTSAKEFVMVLSYCRKVQPS